MLWLNNAIVASNTYFNPADVAQPGGNYTHGAEYPPGSRVLYSAGQVGISPDGSIPNDFFSQADVAWQSISKILRDADMTTDDIIRVNHFLTAPADVEDVFTDLVIPYDNGIAAKHFGRVKPASTLVFIPALVAPQFQLEVEIVAAAAPHAGSGTVPAIRFFDPDDVAPPVGTYSQGAEIAAGARVLHTAGQVGAATDGSVPDDFETQAVNTFRNLLGVMAGDGMNPADLAKIRVFLTDINDLTIYRDIRQEYLGDARPASTLIQIEALAMPELKIEIEVVCATAE